MPTVKSEIVQFRSKPQQARTWKAVAERDDVTLSEFLRRAADHYARRRLERSVASRSEGSKSRDSR